MDTVPPSMGRLAEHKLITSNREGLRANNYERSRTHVSSSESATAQRAQRQFVAGLSAKKGIRITPRCSDLQTEKSAYRIAVYHPGCA